MKRVLNPPNSLPGTIVDHVERDPFFVDVLDVESCVAEKTSGVKHLVVTLLASNGERITLQLPESCRVPVGRMVTLTLREEPPEVRVLAPPVGGETSE